jgi:quinol monooxygenase YgiN
MIEVVWDISVREDVRGHFELAFGPGGAWSKLFAKSTGFQGTTLMRDIKSPGRYLVIELWNDEGKRNQAISENHAEYLDLQTTFDSWTESRIEMGTYYVLAEATVRPRGKAGRRRT